MFLCFTFLKTLNLFVPILNYILLPRFSIWFWLLKLPVFVLYQEKKVIKFGLCLCLAVEPHSTAPFIQTQNKHTYIRHKVLFDFFFGGVLTMILNKEKADRVLLFFQIIATKPQGFPRISSSSSIPRLSFRRCEG